MKFQIKNKNNNKIVNTTDTASWTNQIDQNEIDDVKPQNCGGIFCVLKIVQLGFVFLLLYAFGIVLKTLVTIPRFTWLSSPPPSTLHLPLPFIPEVGRSSLTDPPPSTLLDIRDFHLLIKPDQHFCDVDNLLFLIIIHSKPDHFRQRQGIRSTWGSLKHFRNKENGAEYSWSTRTVFVLGETKIKGNSPPSSVGLDVSDLIQKENERYKDIVVGSFDDEYHNLRYKNVLGLQWASQHCSNAIFFLKADDDSFVDIIGLQSYLNRTFGPLSNKLRDVLAGNVFPSGTHPQREGKWSVSSKEYPWEEYPPYLGGLAYVMTPDVARDLYRAAHSKLVPEVWVDDVWITGLVAHALRIQPLYLNPRYSYDHEEMRSWLSHTHTHAHPPPYTFAHLDPTQKDFKDTLHQLWNRVLLSYNITETNNNAKFIPNNSVR